MLNWNDLPAVQRMNKPAPVACYKQSEAECDEESHKCEMCGQTMCFSHSVRVGGSWSDERMTVCENCARRD